MINLPKIFKQDDFGAFKLKLPLLPLRDIVVFPHMVVPLFVSRKSSINALTDAMNNDKRVFLSLQKKSNIDNPEKNDLYDVGTIGTVLQMLRLPDGTVKVLAQGSRRARIITCDKNDNYFKPALEIIEETQLSPTESAAHCRTISEEFRNYSKINKNISKEIIDGIRSISDPSQLGDTVVAHFSFKKEDKQRLLEIGNIDERLSLLLQLIRDEIEIFTVTEKIKGRVKTQIEKTQKNYYLNEQMRAIKKEMGADDGLDEFQELEKRIKEKEMSEEASTKAEQELNKLKLMSPMSSEATVIRNYIDWLISLPWFNYSEVRQDIDEAEKILNEDHYGLQKPKERILEYLAVQMLVNKLRGPILCFVGPPGVGKTSLAKSIARATKRKFVRLSLGGVRDEAEIRGHRRTYIGALPGKIIQRLKKVGVNNPVFCLDEVDKMSMDFRGDPSSALLEVLDPEQNYSFNDHYLDVDYDLSDIFFITTANTLPDIPLPLQDRMEIIRIPGYTEYEKYNIAKDYLIPKQIKVNGLSKKNIQFSRNAIMSIIQQHTREAGVRNLEREISSVCRKVAKKYVKNRNTDKQFNITYSSLVSYLGQPRFRHGQIEDKDQIGIVTGLAWTQVGGELLCIETVLMPGKGDLIITGKLGDVMKESARAAVSYVRSRSEQLQIKSEFYKEFDIHIHVPEGAIPKDGPSAGIAMCLALVSALTKKPVDRNIAMTGEITLRGRVLPIGGLREKILAAHRGGITKVLIPNENKKDLQDIPKSVYRQIKIICVEDMEEVLDNALILKDNIDSSKKKE